MNGQEGNSYDKTGEMLLGAPVLIGSGYYLGSYTYRYSGKIDEVRIYEKALETAQIKELYYAGLERLLAESKITNEEYQERLKI